MTTVFESDFANFRDPNKSDFFFGDSSFGFVQDFQTCQGKCGGVKVTSRYVQSNPPFGPDAPTPNPNSSRMNAVPKVNKDLYDPNKQALGNVISGTPFVTVGEDQKFYAEVTMAYKGSGFSQNPFGFPKDSPTMGSMGPIITAGGFSQTACLFMTDTGIYAFNDAGSVETLEGLTRSYNSFKKVGVNKPGRKYVLRVEYDRSVNTLRWYIDGVKVAEWDKPGYPAFADYGGMEPSPSNPGIPNIENAVPGAIPQVIPPLFFGAWFPGIANLVFLQGSHTPGGVGGVCLNGPDAYVWPKTWVATDPEEIANNQWKYLRNISESNKCGKKSKGYFYKMKVALDTA